MAKRTIICGMGQVGRHLARDLAEQGMDVVVIDRSEDALAEVETALDVMSLRGHAALPSVLEKARVGAAELVIAVTDHDEINLVTALAAKQRGAKHTVARLGRRDYFQGDTGWQEDLLGVDLILCPGLLVGAEIVRLTREARYHYAENFAGNLIQVALIEIEEDVQAVGRPAANLNLPDACHALAVVRDGRSQPVEAVVSLQPGDHVLIGGLAEALYDADRLFLPRHWRCGGAIIVGGGEMGRNIATQLLPVMDSVTIADRDPAVCEELASSMPEKLRIAHGNGTDLGFLEELDARHARVLVATTGRDETNLMGTMLAKRKGVDQAIALIHRPDYNEVFDALGIDDCASPRLLVAREIRRYIDRRLNALTSQVPIDGGQILEVQISFDSDLVGQQLGDTDLPRGCRVAALVRGGRVLSNPMLQACRPQDVIVAYAPVEGVAGLRRTLLGN